MNVYEAMATQRAVRRLRPDPIPVPVIERIFQAAAWAPTGGNVQPFRMVAVTDREKLAAMGALYSKQWDSYTSSMRAEVEQLAIPRRKMRPHAERWPVAERAAQSSVSGRVLASRAQGECAAFCSLGRRESRELRGGWSATPSRGLAGDAQ